MVGMQYLCMNIEAFAPAFPLIIIYTEDYYLEWTNEFKGQQ